MISIIAPVFNEKDNLSELVSRIDNTLSDLNYEYELILVNDGSTDGSAELINKLSNKNSWIKSIHLLRNYGQTTALSAGIDHSKYEIIVPIDADLQNDPYDIPRLVSKLNEGYDIVSGWRKDRKDSFFNRKFLSTIANYFISKIWSIKLHDNGCSLKAYRKHVLDDINLYGEMHRLLPIYARLNGTLKICELPVKHHKRNHGSSKYGMNRIFKVILDLIVATFLHRYSQKPIYVFGTFGIFNLVASFLCGCGAVFYKYFSASYKSFIQTPLPLMSSMFFSVGILCILMGLLAELSIRTYYESQNKKTYKLKSD